MKSIIPNYFTQTILNSQIRVLGFSIKKKIDEFHNKAEMLR